MAGAGVTTEFRQYWHYIAHIVRNKVATHAGHANADRARLVFVNNLELGLTILHRFHHASLAYLDHIGIDRKREVTGGVVTLTICLHRC